VGLTIFGSDRHAGVRHNWATQCIIAAPVTFRFEAEVASVSPSKGGVALPFTIAPGDTIATTFAFEPTSGGSRYDQLGELRFDIADQQLSISGFTISVGNDALPNAVPLRGEIADPTIIFLSDQGPGSSDGIGLRCLNGSAFLCGSLPVHPEIKYVPAIAFLGEDSSINSTELTDEVSVWNAFTFREMSLLFIDNDAHGEVYIGLYIGSVYAVPEPATSFLLVSGILFLATVSSARIRR
jgi:hypothetical protein